MLAYDLACLGSASFTPGQKRASQRSSHRSSVADRDLERTESGHQALSALWARALEEERVLLSQKTRTHTHTHIASEMFTHSDMHWKVYVGLSLSIHAPR